MEEPVKTVKTDGFERFSNQIFGCPPGCRSNRRLLDNFQEGDDKRCGYQQTVEAVKKSTMARERRAGILDFNASFQEGFDQVAIGAAYNNDGPNHHPLP